MTQLHFTLGMDEFTELFKMGREEAFGKLMENILNQFLLTESTEKLGAQPYERQEERSDYRNGLRHRQVNTRIGKLTLAVPRHRNEAFHTTLLENYQRNEQALIEVFMEMVVNGVATRNVERITKELCGVEFSKSNVSELCKALDPYVESFKNRPLEGDYPFVMADAMYVKVREDHRIRSKGLLMAIGMNNDGRKEVLGFEVCENETAYHWERFFTGLKQRGLKQVDLVTSDSHKGLVSAIKKVFQNASWQRCQFHFSRNIVNHVPKRYQAGLASELSEMFNELALSAARDKKNQIIEEYKDISAKAMQTLEEGFDEAMNVMCLPEKYRKSLRTTNIIERENQELRRREKVIRIFPNVASVERLLGAILLDHHESWSMLNRVFDMTEYLNNRQTYKNQMIETK